MIKVAFGLTVLFVAFAGASGGAEAQYYTNYRYCAVYSLQTVSCAFDTLEQCRMTVSGRGGTCELNGWYQPQGAAGSRKRRPGG